MIGQRLGIRLFIEGIEVPCIGVSMNIAPGAPATAAIQIIATDKALLLWPRTLIHVFFYDFVEASAFLPGSLSDPDTVGGYDSEDYLSTRYKLFFCGELHGITFSKSTNSRTITLTCVDCSNYWDTTYQYNFNGELLVGWKAAFIGANTNLLNSPLGHGVGTIASLLCSNCASFPNMEGLLAGVVHVLEAIGGCYYGEKTFKGCTDFASIAELRLKLLQQVCAAEKDNSTKNLFARKAFSMWMNRQVGSLGQLVTFRSITQIILKMVFHECFPNPVAYYQPGENDLMKRKAYSVSLKKDPRTAGLITTAESMLKSANAALLYIDKFLAAANPMDLAKELSSAFSQLRKFDKQLASQKAVSIVPGVNSLIAQIHKELEATIKASCVSGTTTVNVSALVRTDTQRVADMAMKRVIDALAALLNKKLRKSKEVFYNKEPRLNNQIFRPDIWFAPPPMCNVLFPECYSSFEWSRNYLREVSRLELQTTNEILGDDALFNGRYYAPNIKDIRRNIKLESRKFRQFIMQHELFTGIIPMFEKLSEVNLFAMRKSQVQQSPNPVGYAQRAANFQYFKHRFASRQMSAMGRFNPWFVAGFPALIIDKIMDYDHLAISGLPLEEQLQHLGLDTTQGVKPTLATLLREFIPTQYLGHCIQLSHNVNQSGGSTQYAFTEARIHRESSEFLGVDRAVVSRKNGRAHKKGYYAAFPSNAPKKNGRGPRGGIITGVKKVTDKHKGRMLTVYPSGKMLGKVGSSEVSGYAPIDYYYTNEMGPPSQSTAIKLYEGSETYEAYEITESYTKRIREEIDLPIEEAVCPPWIWSGWKNLEIGNTYQQFFRCGSIIDVEKVTGKDFVDFSPAYEDDILAYDEGMAQGSKNNEEPLETWDQALDRIMGTKKGSRKKTKSGAAKKANKPAKIEAHQTPGLALSADRKRQGLTLIVLEKEKTIEAAVDYLVRLYSMIKLYNLDVEAFLRNYNWRPVATLLDMFGSANLEIRKKPPKKMEEWVLKKKVPTRTFFGNKEVLSQLQSGELSLLSGDGPYALLYKKKVTYIDKGYEVVGGTEGFHSRAFSDESNLFGLVDAKVTKVLGISINNQGVAKKLDMRGTRRAAVREYMEQLTNSRGLLG